MAKALDPNDHHDELQCARAWVALHAAHTLVAKRLSAALATCRGLTINDFEVLVRLERAEPERPRLTDLNQAIALSQPALSRLVARLE